MISFYDCNEVQYIKLLEFFLNKCDTVTFCLPNFGTKFPLKNPSNYIYEYKAIIDSLDRNSMDFENYKKNVQPFLDSLKEDTLNIYHNIQYFDQVCNYEKEIYIIKYNSTSFKVLKTAKKLQNWNYPNFPEDLYFFSKNKCYFSSVSHEGEYNIYDTSESTIRFMEKMNIDFDIDSYDDPPELNQSDGSRNNTRDGSMSHSQSC